MDSLLSRNQLSNYFRYPFDYEFISCNGHRCIPELDIGYDLQWSSGSICYLLNEGE